MTESILQASQEATSGTGVESSGSTIPTLGDPYVLKCRLERTLLKNHMVRLRTMLREQEALQDALFRCQRECDLAATLLLPTPMMGDLAWASRSDAESITTSRELIAAGLRRIEQVLRVTE